jgi:hypothetical protein
MMRNFKRIGFIFLLISLFLIVLPGYADPPLPTPVARVVWVKGMLKATMPNKEQRILQKTSVIYLNDTLTTDSNSQAEIVFTDNSLITFRPDTTFYIDKYQFTPKATKGHSVGKYVMNLVEGGFRTITGLIAKSNPPDYQMNTPVATIGVRGTDYAVYIRNGQLDMIHYSGTPCVSNNKGNICLSAGAPYASVSGASGIPRAVTTRPDVFNEKLNIVPAVISPFKGGGGRGGVGTISSFCIQ